ncbi:MBL fold metallo-hydrolase [Campylobacter sp. MIT 99-7217]|uniref:MBL fold metallo-hydrolase n=1 Tax=Campylobacter sp. MIT 99-7217 TaxID=535091 RepID=UPI00115B3AB1|nr:MBL fold metallo-hydrolase [Campylobacter sp. MIT 99-7217]
MSVKSIEIEGQNKANQILHKGQLIFANESKEAIFPPKVALKQVINYYTTQVKNASPKTKLPFVKSDFKKSFQSPVLAWLGHSSAFLAFRNFKILIDPLFTMHASPIKFINQAFKQTHCFKAEDFGEVFAVLITHSHFDHLDKKSILALKNKATLFIAPLKVGQYLKKFGIESERIAEFDWWQGALFECGKNESVKIIATPSQHNSNRGDGFNKSLWASFVFEFSGKFGVKRLFWSADGGYATHFKKIGDLFGGFDLACLESGHFNKAWQSSHSFPEQIVKEAHDLNAKAVMSIHWARFKAGTHGWNEPVKFLHSAFKELHLPYLTPKIGQLIELDKEFDESLKEKWWDEN